MSDSSARREIVVGHGVTSLRLGRAFVSTVDVSPSGRPSSRAFSKRRMIFPLRVCGSASTNSISLGATAAPSRLRAWPSKSRRSVVVGGEPVLERDEGLDHLADGGIGLADDGRLGHRGMIGQRVLDLERTDQVPGGLDHVVGAADEPEVAVGVALDEVAGQVEAVGEALAVALFLVQIARGTSTAIRGLSASSPSTSGSSMTDTVPSSSRRTTYASTPGSGRPIEPGLMSNAGVLAIMMPPVSVCHQLS